MSKKKSARKWFCEGPHDDLEPATHIIRGNEIHALTNCSLRPNAVTDEFRCGACLNLPRYVSPEESRETLAALADAREIEFGPGIFRR